VVELEHDHGFNSPYNWILEATGLGTGGGYHNNYVDVACENLTAAGSTAIFDYENDWTRNTKIHGTFRSSTLPDGTVKRGRLVLCEQATVHDCVVPDIEIIARAVRPRRETPLNHPSRPTRDEGIRRYPHDITIRDTRIIDEGAIEIQEGAADIVLERVVFEGAPRRVIHIKNDADPLRPVTIALKAIQAPAGATIEADDPANVSVTLDGKKLALPYTF
jgi:hypothetical protein